MYWKSDTWQWYNIVPKPKKRVSVIVPSYLCRYCDEIFVVSEIVLNQLLDNYAEVLLTFIFID